MLSAGDWPDKRNDEMSASNEEQKVPETLLDVGSPSGARRWLNHLETNPGKCGERSCAIPEWSGSPRQVTAAGEELAETVTPDKLEEEIQHLRNILST